MRGYLERGEEVRLAARPHGVALVRPLARTLALAAGGAILVLLGSSVSLAFAVAGAGALALAALLTLADVARWERTRLVVTRDRLFVVHGLLRRSAATVRLSRLSAIEVEQSLLGRALGYGTVVAGDLEIPHVRDPRSLPRLIP